MDEPSPTTDEPATPASSERASSERAIMVEGLRIATAMRDTPRAQLARATLVVLPEAGHPWGDYRAVIERFASERRVFALDWPGFGGSARPAPGAYAYDAAHYAETLVGWLRALGIARAVLLGNGLGATVAIRCAAAQPECVLGLALVAPLGFGQRGLGGRLAGVALRQPSVRGWLDRALTSLALGPTTPEVAAILEARARARTAPERAASVAALAALARNTARSYADLPVLARQVTAPALVVRGALDPVVSEAEARQATLALGARGALEVLLPGAGHLPFLQQPLRFHEAVAGLLATAEMRALGDPR